MQCPSALCPIAGLLCSLHRRNPPALCLPGLLCLQKIDPSGNPTKSAHPARFSPDDKFSRERITLKKRFSILPTQQAPYEM